MRNILQVTLILAFVGLTLSAVEGITAAEIPDIKISKRIWLIYETEHQSNDNTKILDDVSEILTGFYRIGTVHGSANQLKFYGDNGQVKLYSGEFTMQKIVDWALKSTNQVLESRSKVAKQINDNKQFLGKESQRANKQWQNQQNLRLKSKVIVVSPDSWESVFLKERSAVLMNVYEANCSACIQMNKQWEAVANVFKGTIKVIKINITDSEKLEKYIQEQSYPSIRFYPAGNKKVDTFERFTGIKKQFSIREWANEKLSEKKDSVDIPELNKQNYKTLCKTTKATCVIIFTEDPSDVVQNIGTLAAKYLQKPITFLVSQKGSQKAFEKQVGIDQFPDTVMMYCARKKFLKMGGLDFKSIDEAINEITLGNRNNFNKYKFEENLL